MRGARLAILALGVAVASGAGCDKLLGIRTVHVDEVSSGSGGGNASDAGDGPSCSPVTMACAACAECADVVEVTFDDFGAPSSPAIPITGTTAGTSRSTVDPGVECTQALGPERIYAVTVAKAGYLTAKLSREGTTFDSVLYARKGCCDTDDPEGHCSDSRKSNSDHSYHGGEVLSFRVAAGDVWYLVVDGSESESGSYSLDLNLSPGVACANMSWVPITIDPGSPMTLTGDTMALGNQGQNRCFLNHPTGAGDLGEIVYELRAPVGVTGFDLALNGSFDTVLYARSDCVDSNVGSMSELVCQDQTAGPGGEFITNLPNKGAPIYVFVDTGSLSAQSHEYSLIVTPK